MTSLQGEEDFLSYHVAAVCQGLMKTEVVKVLFFTALADRNPSQHAGRYQFDVASDDGASLIIDDILVVKCLTTSALQSSRGCRC